MPRLLPIFFMTLFISSFCHGQDTYLYTQPKDIGDGWETNNLKSQHIDITLIDRLFSQLNSRDNKLHSVLVVKGNQIVLEEYLNGQTAGQKHDLRSATKSITSILLGIAIDKGLINNVNDPILKYLKKPIPKKHLDKRKEQITIKHLMTMSSGLDCNDWDKYSKGQEDRVYKKKNWLQYTLNLPMINDPGTVANYCTMGQILATEIVSQASAIAIDQFAQQYLFDPLNINNISWGHTSKKKVIASGKRLYMTSRDMAKIGQLILNQGKWNGIQIVSKKWITESTTPKTQITGVDYGYLWWNIPFKIKEKTIVSKAALGNGGQYIMVIPGLDMVAIFTGGAYNSQDDKLPFAIMQDILLPTFMR